MKVKTALRIFNFRIFLGACFLISLAFPVNIARYILAFLALASLLLSFYIMLAYWHCPQCKSYLGRGFNYQCKKCGQRIEKEDKLERRYQTP